MKITSIANWTPRPGRALRWNPTRSCADAAAATPGFDGPIGFLAENHIRGCHAARAAGRPHTAYIGSGIEVSDPLDTDALTRALEAWVCRHPVLRLWFDIDEGAATVTGHLVDSEMVRFEASDAGVLRSAEETTEHLLSRFGAEASAASFPGFAFGAIDTGDGFAVFLACDHALSDGVSQALALDEIVECYRDIRHGHTPEQESDNGGYLEYVALENTLTQTCLGDPEQLRGWQELFARHDFAMPRFPLDLGLGPGESAPVAPFAVSILNADELIDFDNACAAAGGKFIDGVYAAVAVTDHELGGADDYFGMTVLNTRAVAPKFTTSQGWFCSFAPVGFRVTGAASFTDLMPRALEGRRRAKEFGAVPTAAALAGLAMAGATAEDVVTVPNMLSYIDFRWFPGDGKPEYENAVMFTGEGRTANASMWINRDRDELYIGSQTPDTAFAQTQTRRYFRHLRGVFRDIARDGDRPIPGRCYDESAVAADDFAAAVLVAGGSYNRED